jgi:hypothetical protein
MVSVAENNERRATASPFGLMADLGCAYAAQLGWPLVHIGRQLGVGVSDETVRAAVVRGRRELATRRIAAAKVNAPRPTPPPTPSPHPSAPGPQTAAGTRKPAAQTAAPDDSIEALLTWAQSGPQRAAMLAAKVRTLLVELEALQQERRRDNAKQYARRDERRRLIPVGPDDTAERRAYFAKVRTWALANGHHAPENRIVPTTTIRAYEAAHAAQPQQSADEGDPHSPG